MVSADGVLRDISEMTDAELARRIMDCCTTPLPATGVDLRYRCDSCGAADVVTYERVAQFRRLLERVRDMRGQES